MVRALPPTRPDVGRAAGGHVTNDAVMRIDIAGGDRVALKRSCGILFGWQLRETPPASGHYVVEAGENAVVAGVVEEPGDIAAGASLSVEVRDLREDLSLAEEV